MFCSSVFEFLSTSFWGITIDPQRDESRTGDGRIVNTRPILSQFMLAVNLEKLASTFNNNHSLYIEREEALNDIQAIFHGFYRMYGRKFRSTYLDENVDETITFGAGRLQRSFIVKKTTPGHKIFIPER